MRFIKIPRTFLNLKEGTKFIDVLVYAAIALHTDSGKARIGMRTIAEKYDIASSKVEAAIDRLKKNGFISYTKLPSLNNEYVFNEYEFPEIKDFLMLKPELLDEELKPKDRGILIYLQLVAERELNTIMAETIQDVAAKIGITRQTMSKYLKSFLDNGYITKPRRYYECRYLAGKNNEIKENVNYNFIIE